MDARGALRMNETYTQKGVGKTAAVGDAVTVAVETN